MTSCLEQSTTQGPHPDTPEAVHRFDQFQFQSFRSLSAKTHLFIYHQASKQQRTPSRTATMSTNPSHSTGTGTSSASAAAPLAGGAPAPTSTHGAGASSGTGSTVPGTHSGTVPAAASSFPSSGAGASAGASTGTGTGSSGTQSLSTSEAQPQAIPGQAGMDPEIPRTADEAPVFGVEAAKDVPFGEQVKGHAK